jgi:hypothetical protein
MSSFWQVKAISKEMFTFFTTPRAYWQRIKEGSLKGSFGFANFFVPSIFSIAVLIFAGEYLFNSEEGFLLKLTLVKIAQRIVFLFTIILLSVLIIRQVKSWFNIPMRMRTVRSVVIYSLSPALVTSMVVGLFPFFELGGILPWYGFFLAYTGFETFLNVPEKLKFYFYFVSFSLLFFMIVLITFILQRFSLYIMN